MPLYVDIRQTILRHYYRRLYMFNRLPMKQKFMIILIPILLICGTMVIYRSYPSPEILTVVPDGPVRVDFYVMSKCPDARKCETLFGPTLLKLSSIMNFTVSYIAQEPRSNEFQCMHGDEECIGNKQQLCVQSTCSQTTLIKFLQCQSKQLQNIPNNGEECYKEATDGSSKWSDIQSCVQSDKANELFHKALQRTRSASATKSCTMHLNGKLWCIHDGYWSKCTEGHDEKSLIKSICSRYNGDNKPAECSTSV